MNERLKDFAEQSSLGFEYDEHQKCFERFAELVRADERERIAIHFDSRIDNTQVDNGWYEPQEPAEIIRELK